MKYKISTIDPLTKLFKDSPLPLTSHTTHAVRGEVASTQIALKVDNDAKVTLLNPVRLYCNGSELIGKMNFLGLVPVRQNTPDTEIEELVKKAPALFPDPILDSESIEILNGEVCPIWLTVPIPEDITPGVYHGVANILCGQDKLKCEVNIIVHKTRLTRKRNLYVTNWFWPDKLALYFDLERWSDEYWEYVERVAQDMASHRQNVILVHIWDLLEFYLEDGRLKVDFRRFDKWVETFDKHGVAELIEGSHIGGREGGAWKAENFVLAAVKIKNSDGSIACVIENARAGSRECKKFLSEFLPLLTRHLSEKRWLSRYIQHVADEPIKANAQSWKMLSANVKEFAPQIRRVDANMFNELESFIDIWVPLLDLYDNKKEFYASRQKKRDEAWFYTCLFPRSVYPNRFIDFSLLKARLLHWINFRHGLTGYLHWGYNWWSREPFKDVEPEQSPGSRLPPGDNAIVYPGKDGVIPSIRWEMVRKGIEDYELLLDLDKHRPEIASRLTSEAVPDIKKCMNRIEDFNLLRLRLIESLDSVVSE